MAQSVTELVTRLRQTVEMGVGEQSVAGEIGSCKVASSGHIYFTLKDAQSQLQCALYSFRARMLRLRLREGMQVELRGKATVWEGRGSLQFIVESVREAGVGTLQQRFEALKQRLQQEGLFSPERKRPLPEFPQSVGLITSATGAVIQDMRHRLEQRAPWMQVYLLPVQVQGKGAEHGIARALHCLGHAAEYGLPQPEYIILARGGGSLEDLWCFNEEVVARAIAACPLPVVSAIGHETDFTIADFVADLRAPTPTAAIELSTPDAAELQSQLQATEQHIRRQLQRALQWAGMRLQILEQSRLRSPMELLAPYGQQLDVLHEDIFRSSRERMLREGNRLSLLEARLSSRAVQERLGTAAQKLRHTEQHLLSLCRNRLVSATARLDALAAHTTAAHPQRALERGFALVGDGNGSLLRSTDSLHEGDALDITLASGRLSARITRILPAHADSDSDTNY